MYFFWLRDDDRSFCNQSFLFIGVTLTCNILVSFEVWRIFVTIIVWDIFYNSSQLFTFSKCLLYVPNFTCILYDWHSNLKQCVSEPSHHILNIRFSELLSPYLFPCHSYSGFGMLCIASHSSQAIFLSFVISCSLRKLHTFTLRTSLVNKWQRI